MLTLTTDSVNAREDCAGLGGWWHRGALAIEEGLKSFCELSTPAVTVGAGFAAGAAGFAGAAAAAGAGAATPACGSDQAREHEAWCGERLRELALASDGTVHPRAGGWVGVSGAAMVFTFRASRRAWHPWAASPSFSRRRKRCGLSMQSDTWMEHHHTVTVVSEGDRVRSHGLLLPERNVRGWREGAPRCGPVWQTVHQLIQRVAWEIGGGNVRFVIAATLCSRDLHALALRNSA